MFGSVLDPVMLSSLTFWIFFFLNSIYGSDQALKTSRSQLMLNTSTFDVLMSLIWYLSSLLKMVATTKWHSWQFFSLFVFFSLLCLCAGDSLTSDIYFLICMTFNQSVLFLWMKYLSNTLRGFLPATSIHLDLRMNCLDFDHYRSKFLWPFK